MEPTTNTFAALRQIAPAVDKKGKLSYVSWPEAWASLKDFDPAATFEWHTNERGALGIADERAVWAHVSVTVKGQTLSAWLPCMDHRNAAIAPEKVTGMDINKAYQRAFVKAIAMHGLGLHVYMGEDLPETPASAAAPAPAEDRNGLAIPRDELRAYYHDEAEPRGWTAEQFAGMLEQYRGKGMSAGSLWRRIKGEVEADRR